mgnify:CR=1 FL=1
MTQMSALPEAAAEEEYDEESPEESEATRAEEESKDQSLSMDQSMDTPKPENTKAWWLEEVQTLPLLDDQTIVDMDSVGDRLLVLLSDLSLIELNLATKAVV